MSVDVLLRPTTTTSMAALESAVDAVQDLVPQEWAAGARAEHLHRLRVAIDRLEASFLQTVAAADAAGDAAALDGARSTRAWLSDRLRLAPGDAGERVKLARAGYRGRTPLEPATQALARGEVSYDAVRAIGRAVSDLEPQAARRGAGVLTDLAREADVARVRVAARRLRYVIDPERGKADFEAQFQARKATFAPLLDGMYALDATVEPEGAAVLDAALNALMSLAGADDRRTTPQRRYDALIELARQQLEAGELPVGGGVRPQVVVTCTAQTLAASAGARSGPPAGSDSPGTLLEPGTLPEPATLPDGAILPVETLGRLVCDPAVERVLFGGQGEVLDYGRSRRLFSPAQRKALRARDQGCRFPGCGLPWAQAHHVVPWQRGGVTDLSNALSLCQVHHRRVHEDGWRIELDDQERGANAVVIFVSPTGEYRRSDGRLPP